jgi:hypothetical protein
MSSAGRRELRPPSPAVSGDSVPVQRRPRRTVNIGRGQGSTDRGRCFGQRFESRHRRACLPMAHLEYEIFRASCADDIAARDIRLNERNLSLMPALSRGYWGRSLPLFQCGLASHEDGCKPCQSTEDHRATDNSHRRPRFTKALLRRVESACVARRARREVLRVRSRLIAGRRLICRGRGIRCKASYDRRLMVVWKHWRVIWCAVSRCHLIAEPELSRLRLLRPNPPCREDDR